MATLINALTGFAHVSGTVSTTSLAVTDAPFSVSADNLAAADAVWISAYANTIRFRIDGGAATAATGHQLVAGARVEIVGNVNVRNLRLIRESADATVTITLLKFP